MKHIVSSDWLAERLDAVRIIDCRFYLGNPTRGLEEYICEHIPNALYFDLEKDLSGNVQTHGGRHPLPAVSELVAKLSAAGIDQQTTVVAYDDQSGAMAARFWWLLRYLGHRHVYVLDGGYTKWKERGYPTTDAIVPVKERTFLPQCNPSLLATVEDVRNAVEHETALLVDSRERNRYLGLSLIHI